MREGQDDRAIEECVERHRNIFGDDYFLEIMPHDSPEQSLVNLRIANTSMNLDQRVVATGDSHYPYEDWKDTQDVLLMIATGQTLTKRKAKQEAGEDVYTMDLPLHMFSEEEMKHMFRQYHPNLSKQFVEAALKNTQLIADSIEPFDIDRSDKFPKSKGERSDALLIDWCEHGLKRIDKVDDPEYRERLTHELNTMGDMGVVDYMVLVGNMVRWARSEGIRVSSGRGSAAGSLVCYLVGITNIDPIAHELLFERFLNPNRKGMPDIDLDFQSDRRDDVKKWLQDEYGKDRVCNIASFMTYQPKGALKDAARVLDVDFGYINMVSKVIPEATDVGGAGNVPPLRELRDQHEEIKEFSKKYPEVWKHALRIEGSVKGLSRHAAGVIVTDQPIDEYMPLMRGSRKQEKELISQWSSRAEADIISYANFPKIDILSLDGLTKQGHTIELIKEHYGVDVDLDNIPVGADPEATEPEIMELFAKGHTLGVFQFGGSVGIINFLRHVKPDRFEDLIACNALWRPGALEGGDAFRYGDIKKGKIPATYWHESVKPILGKTYGVMIYQEQLQQIAQALGNFSPSESDDMRKATSKLYRMGKAEARHFMENYHEQWMKGCEENEIRPEDADDIWERMIAFGAYSFNRSHSASYSLEAYRDGWLKVKYPIPFYASQLTYDDHPDKAVREARAREIKVSPPNINLSEDKFTISDDVLLYGLMKVKYVGTVAYDAIREYAPYESLKDFDARIPSRRCNKRVREHLIKAGAFDSLGVRDHLTTTEKRVQEEEALGVALSGTGVSGKYSNIIEPRIFTEEQIEELQEGKGATIGGEISTVNHHTIKSGRNKGSKMGFASVSFKENSWDITLFREKYVKYKNLLKEGNVVMVRGRKGDRGGLIVDNMINIERLAKELEK